MHIAHDLVEVGQALTEAREHAERLVEAAAAIIARNRLALERSRQFSVLDIKAPGRRYIDTVAGVCVQED